MAVVKMTFSCPGLKKKLNNNNNNIQIVDKTFIYTRLRVVLF
jgi:hypothetical protein